MIPTMEALARADNSLPLQALFYTDCTTHLDLGSNDGRTLRGLDPQTITAVELFEPSVRKLRTQGLAEVLFQDVRMAVVDCVATGKHYDRVAMFDVIEHLPRADGETLLDQLEAIATREIVFFVPVETPELHADPEFQAYREWGLSQHPDGQRKLHDHLSFWCQKDFEDRGYIVMTLHDFHREGLDAFFAAKYVHDEDRETVVARITALLQQPQKTYNIIQPLMLAGEDHMDIGRGVIIAYGARLECITQYQGQAYEPHLTIGKHTTAEMFLHIGCAGQVSIGMDCIIAGHVTIMDHEHGMATDRLLHGQPLDVGEVEVGDSCFIGEGATILKGVHIGQHAVIGAGAVVTSDIPAYSLAVGVPARPIRRFDQPIERTKTSIIIPTYNGLDDLRACLESIEAHTPEPHEIIIVDNGSTDETAAFLQEWDTDEHRVKVAALTRNLGFPAAVNRGLRLATGDYVCLLNNDTEVTPGWLGAMLDVMQDHPEAGLVGPMGDNVSGWQHSEGRWDGGGSTEVQRLVGFCLLIRRAVIDKIGGLDERFGLGNYDDDDYCLRALVAGFKCRIARAAFVHHKGFATWPKVGMDLNRQLVHNRQVLLDKWGITEGESIPLQEFDPALHYVPFGEVVYAPA